MKRKGFLLYIVIALLLALAILAFALNDFKRGAVTQLARNVEQNRLMLVAKSANAEVLALIRTQVNLTGDSGSGGSIFRQFRECFPDNSGNTSPINKTVAVLSDFEPKKTVAMANESGYDMTIKSNANLTIFREAAYKSVCAYNGYLDIYSKAYRNDSPENAIEVYERHDVRLIDLRHNLDKYALFVKNYSPDLNNTQRRVIVQGVNPSNGTISRVYLGNDNYPEKSDPENKLWLDLCFDEITEMPGFKTIFKQTTPTAFRNGTGNNCMFYSNKVNFTDIFPDLNSAKPLFYHVEAVKTLYEDFVNKAANGCANNPNLPVKLGNELVAKCNQYMPNSNNNSAAYRICKDYVDHFKTSQYDGKTVNDYSGCETFNTLLQTCMENWIYHYGYLDAANIWKVSECERPNRPRAQDWVKFPFYGLSYVEADYIGPYFDAYLKEKNGKPFNKERLNIGKMLRLYGENNNTPVLVEGPVNVRFYKIGFFDDFKKTLEFFTMNHEIHPEKVPILFRRQDFEKTFQSKPVDYEFSSNKEYFKDNTLMSQDIVSVPANALLLNTQGSGPSYYNGDGVLKNLSREDVYSDYFDVPSQKSDAGRKSGTYFGRLVDFKNVSYNYPSPSEFLADRVIEENGKKILSVDGIMYIQKGDMNLTDINYFYGKGLIYLGTGNITFGNFERYEGRDHDSVRFYVREGDILLGSSESDITIEASLAALFYKVGSGDPKYQGSLVLNNKKKVHILGNLIVDYLYTQDTSGKGLSAGGQLIIEHDPIIMDPHLTSSSGSLDPYQISIGRMKTAFAVNATGADE